MQLDALPPGARFGDLQVVRRLGQGGMGVVFEAVDVRLGRPVAVKVPSLALLQEPTSRARFEREARASALVQHPNVVTVHAVADVGGWPYLVLELMPGGSLRDRLRTRGPLPWRDACALARELALGLDAIHAAGLVHRDLKPENVLFDAQGRPKLADLGLVRGVQGSTDLTHTGQLLGTRAYMAPEQIDQARQAGPPADLYSLGCVLHELLAGTPPFPGSGYDVITKHLQAPPPRLKDVPAPLAALVLSLLAKAPEGRPPSARAVIEALDGALAQASAPAARGPALAVALGAGVALALGAVGVAWIATRRAPPSSTPPDGPTVARPPEAPTPTAAPDGTPTATPPPPATTAPEPRAGRALQPGASARVEALLTPGEGLTSLSSVQDHGVLAGDRRGVLRLRRASDGGVVEAQAQHRVAALAVLTPARAVSASRAPAQTSLEVWGARELTRSAPVPYGFPPPPPGQDTPQCLWSLAVSRDGRRALLGSNFGHVTLVDLEAPGAAPTVLEGAGRQVCVAFAGERLAVGGDRERQLSVWDLSPGAPRTPVGRVTSPDVVCVAASADGLIVLTGGADGRVVVTDVSRPAAPSSRDLGRHPRSVQALALSPDGRHALSGDEAGAVALWDVRAPSSPLDTWAEVQGTKVIAVGFLDPTTAVIGWANEEVRVLRVDVPGRPDQPRFVEGASYDHGAAAFRVAAAPSHQFVSTDAEGRLRLWRDGRAEVIQAHDSWALLAVAGQRAVTVARHFQMRGDRRIRGWELRGRTGAELGEHDFQAVNEATKVWGLDADAEGRVALASSTRGEISLFEPGGRVRRLRAGEQPVLRFCPRRALLVAGDRAGALLAWDLSAPGETLEPVLSARPHRAVTGQEGVADLDVTPDGQVAVTIGVDDFVAFTPLTPGEPPSERATPEHTHSAIAVAVSPDGRLAVSMDQRAQLMLWDVATRRRLALCDAERKGARALAFTGPRRIVAAVGDAVVEWTIEGVD